MGEPWALDQATGNEIKKERPCVVVSSDLVKRLDQRIIVPLTSWQDFFSAYFYMVRINRSKANGLHADSAADCFQVKSFDVEKFVDRCGVCSSQDMEDIIAAIQIVLGVTP